MRKVLQKIKEKKVLYDMLFLVIITFIISIPLLKKDINIYFDEGIHFISRAYSTYKSLLQNGESIIITDFSNDFGYAYSLFNGILPTMMLIITSLLTMSFINGFKFLTFIIVFLAGLSMYKLIMEIMENRYTSLIASSVYILSPYFLNNLFIRHSLSESITFIFIPLVFLGLYNLFNTEKKHYYLVIGFVRINFNSKRNLFYCRNICFNLLPNIYKRVFKNKGKERNIN